jgi:hypothetical protein
VFDRMTQSIINWIWLAGSVTELLVICLLFYRHVWRTLPLFCLYCIWDLVDNLALMGLARFAPNHAFDAQFTATIIDSIFLFCVLVELAWSVLRPIRASLSRSSLILVGLLILVAGVAIWPFAALQSLSHAVSHEGLLYVQLQQTIAILRILFFLVLAGGSQLLSIGWRDRELQVATGFGLYSIVSLTIAVMQTHQTTASQWFDLALAGFAGYIGCLLYWAVSFAQREAERREFTPQMQKILLAVAGAARSARVGIRDSQGKPRTPNDK